jgi:GNAT superfamily N-acetyltransferase
MEIIEVKPDSRRDVRQFIDLPFDLYRDIPQWVPPLLPGEYKRFKPDFPFYKHSEAVFFLVRDDEGKAAGRIAVLEHRPHNDYRKAKDALLYLYEACDDDQIARMLFDAAEKWARSRGLNRLVGPKGFLTVGEGLGLLVDGFEHRPAFGIPYNPAYYVRQWEEIGGMAKEVDYLSALIRRDSYTYPPELHELAERVKQRRGFSVPHFTNKKALLAYVPAIQKAYNEAFASVWSYTPIPDEDMQGLVDKLITVADPKMLKLIFKDDQVIGFIFVYPDISEGIQRIKGRLWPLGWLVLLTEKSRTKWLNFNGNAILPQYQGLGANIVMYDELGKTLLEATQFDYADLVQVQEDNVRMLGDLEKTMALAIYKRHRIYAKKIG